MNFLYPVHETKSNFFDLGDGHSIGHFGRCNKTYVSFSPFLSCSLYTWLCVYTYTYIYIYIHTYIWYIYICIYTRINIYVMIGMIVNPCIIFWIIWIALDLDKLLLVPPSCCEASSECPSPASKSCSGGMERDWCGGFRHSAANVLMDAAVYQFLSKNMWVCLKIGCIPNEIAI